MPFSSSQAIAFPTRGTLVPLQRADMRLESAPASQMPGPAPLRRRPSLPHRRDIAPSTAIEPGPAWFPGLLIAPAPLLLM